METQGMTDFIGKTCSHGVSWNDHCQQCELVSAREIVAHWGETVDRARAAIHEAERRRLRSLPNLQDQLISEGMDADAARDHVRRLIDAQEKR
jgi:hypothetical protein